MNNDGHTGWDGVERRVDAHLGRFKEMLNDHTRDEMERYDQIIDMQDQLENKIVHLDGRIGEMNKSISAFMESHGEFIRGIKRAFPKDDDGKPDYDGHNKAHLSWIRSAPEEKELMEYVRNAKKKDLDDEEFKKYLKKVITGGVALAAVSWLWAVVWPAFLSGPKG